MYVCPDGIIENLFSYIWCKRENSYHVIISPPWSWDQLPRKLLVVNLVNNACKLQDLLFNIKFSNCKISFLPQVIYPNKILRNAVLKYVCIRAYTNAVSSCMQYISSWSWETGLQALEVVNLYTSYLWDITCWKESRRKQM